MSGWVKHFLDGKEERGSDADVASKKASWSRGRLEGMNGASIHHDKMHLSIAGLGSYWQSDDYESTMKVHSESRLVARRIMKQLLPGERVIQVLQTEHSVMLRVLDFRYGGGELLMDERLEVVPEGKTGHWLVLEYKLDANKIHWYYSEGKI